MLVPDGVRDELGSVLERDATQMGEVHRVFLSNPEASNADIVAAGASANGSAAGNVRTMINCVLNGTIPTSTVLRKQSVAKVRKLQREPGLSADARGYLDSLTDELENLTGHAAVVAAAEADALRVAGEAVVAKLDQKAEPCIYVYAFPHYMNTFASPTDERTWLKVGYTSGDPKSRIGSQMRQTGMPEDPVLLRVYQASGVDMGVMERRFHGVLVAFGHRRADGKSTGREWFMTSVEALDALAGIAGLTVTYNIDAAAAA